jgi:hypothetical protein
MSKGLILKDSAHKTTLHKNARKYTQKISNTRILLLIIRLLRLFLWKNNIMVTFHHIFSTQKSSTHPSNCNPNHQAQQKKQPQPHSDPATTLVTAKVGRRAMYQLHKHTTTIESVTRCLTLSTPPLPRSYHHQAALSPTTTNAYLGLCISIEPTFVVIPYI